MRRVYLFVLSGFLILTSAMEAQGALDLSLQIGTPQATISFVYSDYYRVEPAVISRLESKKLSSNDVAVALFLSTRARRNGKGIKNEYPKAILFYPVSTTSL